MYQYIISPYNNNKYSINKTIGRKILKKYINNLIGRGTNQLNRRIGSTAKYMNDLSNLKYFYTRGLLTCSFIVIYKKKRIAGRRGRPRFIVSDAIAIHAITNDKTLSEELKYEYNKLKELLIKHKFTENNSHIAILGANQVEGHEYSKYEQIKITKDYYQRQLNQFLNYIKFKPKNINICEVIDSDILVYYEAGNLEFMDHNGLNWILRQPENTI